MAQLAGLPLLALTASRAKDCVICTTSRQKGNVTEMQNCTIALEREVPKIGWPQTLKSYYSVSSKADSSEKNCIPCFLPEKEISLDQKLENFSPPSNHTFQKEFLSHSGSGILGALRVYLLEHNLATSKTSNSKVDLQFLQSILAYLSFMARGLFAFCRDYFKEVSGNFIWASLMTPFTNSSDDG